MAVILCIPDVHLKPYMFDKAKAILESGQADMAVQLGDLVDDWGEEFNLGLYKRTIDRAKHFHATFPNTLWCIGNHDFGYIDPTYGKRQTGFSWFVSEDMNKILTDFYREVGGEIVHKVDNVLFSHAGVTQEFADDFRKEVRKGKDLLSLVNNAPRAHIWTDHSPIWVRPQDTGEIMYGGHLQVVGHTPVKTIKCVDNLLSTDVFSTYRNGAPYGERRFAIVDTKKETWEYAKENE